MLFQEGQVLGAQLVLEGLGGRGDHGPPAALDHRDEVGQRLAGAGAGRHGDVGSVIDGLRDQLSHLELARASFTAAREVGGELLDRLDGRRSGIHPATLPLQPARLVALRRPPTPAG